LVISVGNTITIVGPVAAVFDLVTTARFWPQWHPATRAIGGVTQRPYQLGELIHERAEIGGVTAQGTWKVTEHLRPSRVVLQEIQSPLRITYAFQAHAPEVVFQRQLDYDEEMFRPLTTDLQKFEEAMHQESAQGMDRLKALVESILREEVEPLS
jgi:hypothetical protein